MERWKMSDENVLSIDEMVVIERFMADVKKLADKQDTGLRVNLLLRAGFIMGLLARAYDLPKAPGLFEEPAK